MLLRILTAAATVLLGVSFASAAEQAPGDSIPVEGGRPCRTDHFTICLTDFGFDSIDQPGPEALRASMSNGEWGPELAISIDRRSDGVATLTTSVFVFDEPVKRTAVLAPEAANRMFATGTRLIDSPVKQDRPGPVVTCSHSRELWIEMRLGQRSVSRYRNQCWPDPLSRMVGEMVDLAIAQQPDCAPLADGRALQLDDLSWCHRIRGDVRAGAGAATAARKLIAYRWDNAAKPMEAWFAPNASIDWMGEERFRGPQRTADFLRRLYASRRWLWGLSIDEVEGRSADMATVYGWYSRQNRESNQQSEARYEQTWVRTAREGWRLRAWKVEPLRNCEAPQC